MSTNNKPKSLIRHLTTKLRLPSVPTTSLPNSLLLKGQREAALRERGLLPPKDLSQLERERDIDLPIPLHNPDHLHGTETETEADRIKNEWKAKNIIPTLPPNTSESILDTPDSDSQPQHNTHSSDDPPSSSSRVIEEPSTIPTEDQNDALLLPLNDILSPITEEPDEPLSLAQGTLEKVDTSPTVQEQEPHQNTSPSVHEPIATDTPDHEHTPPLEKGNTEDLTSEAPPQLPSKDTPQPICPSDDPNPSPIAKDETEEEDKDKPSQLPPKDTPQPICQSDEPKPLSPIAKDEERQTPSPEEKDKDKPSQLPPKDAPQPICPSDDPPSPIAKDERQSPSPEEKDKDRDKPSPSSATTRAPPPPALHLAEKPTLSSPQKQLPSPPYTQESGLSTFLAHPPASPRSLKSTQSAPSVNINAALTSPALAIRTRSHSPPLPLLPSPTTTSSSHLAPSPRARTKSSPTLPSLSESDSVLSSLLTPPSSFDDTYISNEKDGGGGPPRLTLKLQLGDFDLSGISIIMESPVDKPVPEIEKKRDVVGPEQEEEKEKEKKQEPEPDEESDAGSDSTPVHTPAPVPSPPASTTHTSTVKRARGSTDPGTKPEKRKPAALLFFGKKKEKPSLSPERTTPSTTPSSPGLPSTTPSSPGLPSTGKSLGSLRGFVNLRRSFGKVGSPPSSPGFLLSTTGKSPKSATSFDVVSGSSSSPKGSFTLPSLLPLSSSSSSSPAAAAAASAPGGGGGDDDESGTVTAGYEMRQALDVTFHSRGSILLNAAKIEDEESRRLSEMAFLT